MRALGFCVSVEHAHWMARKFVAAGLRAAALDASSPRDERADQIRRLRDGELQILFAVYLFNEGLDIPEIDTVPSTVSARKTSSTGSSCIRDSIPKVSM